MRYRSNHNQKGFTILELLIATSVFSVILLLCMSALLQIGRTYYKGIITTRTQEVARGIMTDIAENIQFSGGEANPIGSAGSNSTGFCINKYRYSVALFRQYTGSNHSLVVDSNQDGGGQPCGSLDAQDLDAGTLDSSSREFLQTRMRVIDLTISPTGNNLYRVSLTLAYGDDDLFIDRDNSDTFNAADEPYSCISGPGSQFCAITSLTTTVQKRVK